ncbi:CD209 antigen-like protein D [Gadus macrocephalus]|uniref:CD209 antigen-like protein D n=1 Tax=Gadus macrocephalus TaxID=80720 RepID=UPI0028CB9237|nr:CD209 antigen-like protein D [Gadus macrocephalus]
MGVTPDGWRFFNWSLYFISTTKRNWTASRDDCLQRNADLVVINSKGEQEFATKWQNSFWIGLRLDRDTDRTWKWVDGTNVTFSSWLSGEPNNYHGAEDCVVAWNVGWYDGICPALYFWICEKAVALDNLVMK